MGVFHSCFQQLDRSEVGSARGFTMIRDALAMNGQNPQTTPRLLIASNRRVSNTLACHCTQMTQKRHTNSRKGLWPHQPSLGALGPYIIDTLLLFQCFEKDDHHGSATLSSVGPFGLRRRPEAAIFSRGASACRASGRERKPVGDLPSAGQRWGPDDGGGWRR